MLSFHHKKGISIHHQRKVPLIHSYTHASKIKSHNNSILISSTSLLSTPHNHAINIIPLPNSFLCHNLKLQTRTLFPQINKFSIFLKRRKKQRERGRKSKMGNSIGRSRKVKVMKIDGETFKLKTPAIANDVVKDYPGHVLLDSQAVKHFGLRAKPLEPDQELKPKKIYFLVELPKIRPEEDPALPRRVRSSGVRSLNAKERLDLLMLSKRSVSDLTLVKPDVGLGGGLGLGPTRVRMRLPKAQLEKLMEESSDGAEVAEKIVGLYKAGGGGVAAENGGLKVVNFQHNHKPRGKRVSFSPMENEEIGAELVASHQ